MKNGNWNQHFEKRDDKASCGNANIYFVTKRNEVNVFFTFIGIYVDRNVGIFYWRKMISYKRNK